MKMTAAVAMTLAMAACAQAGEKILVYVSGVQVPSFVLVPAEDIAGRMFATAGVAVEWRPRKPHAGQVPQEGGAIVMHFSMHTPPEEHRGALAYALPYEGIHIEVMYDRIRGVCGKRGTPTSGPRDGP